MTETEPIAAGVVVLPPTQNAQASFVVVEVVLEQVRWSSVDDVVDDDVMVVILAAYVADIA